MSMNSIALLSLGVRCGLMSRELITSESSVQLDVVAAQGAMQFCFPKGWF